MSLFWRNPLAAIAFILLATTQAAVAAPADLATRFGARQAVTALRLSPDGSRVAFIAPLAGQGTALMIRGTGANDPETMALSTDGNPQRIGSCNWISDTRLACTVYAVVRGTEIVVASRIVAVDADGGNVIQLSTRQGVEARGTQLYGGDIIDWLPDDNNAVLMVRNHVPDDELNSRIGSTARGLGVDRVDTIRGRASRVEAAKPLAADYISDGQGNVRVMGSRQSSSTGYVTPDIQYSFRLKGSREWQPLSTVNVLTGDGFDPYAVDSDKDVAYGFRKKDGRYALFSKALDGSGTETLVFDRPDVDVGGLIRIGRNNRVVGITYATDITHAVYFDPAIKAMMAALSRALPDTPLLRVVDSSADENRILLWAGADNDPGVHYLYDRKRGELGTFLVSRPALEGVPLANVRAVTYPARDGVPVPGYLTLPPGKDTARGLPAIVLPHGGPSARDVWGFDWLSQYFAVQGYAVLQPNFRGSAGYGDGWFQENGFQSWKLAVGDVVDAGHWLVKQGIADPQKLAILGWSYGGYAALQSAVMEPGLFRAVVAIAPVTDLATLKEQSRGFTNYRIVRDFIGTGPHIVEGSPAQNAERIQVPVLLFHGGLDRNVLIRQSEMMASRLKSAGKSHRLITWDRLDHYLDDNGARTTLLRESDNFLKQAFGDGAQGANAGPAGAAINRPDTALSTPHALHVNELTE